MYTSSIEGLTRKVWLLAAITLVNRSGSMVLPFLTYYLSEGLTFSKSKIAIVAFCYGVGSLIGSFSGGILTDKFGSYKVASTSLILSAFAFFGFLISTDFTFLCIWSIIAIAITDCFRPAIMVNIGEHSEESTLTRGISLIRMAMNLGVSVGPVIGGLVIKFFDFHWIFIIDGITCLLAGLFYVKVFRDRSAASQKRKESSMMQALTDIPFVLFMLFNLFNLFAFFQVIESLPLFIADNGYNELHLSIFFFFNGFAIFILELPLIHYLEKKYKPLDCVIVGVVLIGLAYACLYLIPNFWWAISVYSILLVIGEIVNFPFVTSMAHKRAGEDQKGSYMGVTSLMFSCAFLLAPFGLNIVDVYSYGVTWIVMTVLCVMSIVGLLLLRQWLSKQP